MKRLLFVSLLLAAAAVVHVTGCKQGEGERCQVSDDCTPPLVCNKAKNTCQGTSGGDLDAPLPVDAPIDMPMPDAAIDAVPAG